MTVINKVSASLKGFLLPLSWFYVQKSNKGMYAVKIGKAIDFPLKKNNTI